METISFVLTITLFYLYSNEKRDRSYITSNYNGNCIALYNRSNAYDVDKDDFVNGSHLNPTFDEKWTHTEGFVVNGGIKIRL